MNENKNQTTKLNSNPVGANVFARDYRGITLVALIITIIVMLILVGISITIALNGGLFDTTKKAAKETEEAKRKEQELSSGRIKIDGVWYDSLEDYAIGKESAVQGIVDLDERNTKFKYKPEGWTNGEVKVEIDASAVATGFTLKYSTDNINWNDYTTEIPINSNGAIYAKLVDSEGNEGGAITGNVSSIDKQAPTINTDLTAGEATDTTIPLNINVTDSVSGISKIEWYYKKDTDPESEYAKNKKTDEYKTMNGKEAGEKGAVTKEKTLTGLMPLSTYNIYAEVYDVAGNVARSPQTGTINITTKEKESYLGKSATIDGKKFIVLYDPGEVGKGAELISANTLAPNNVYLGYQDGQIDWTNANVIAEADLNNNSSLTSQEKALYSYNHAVETLNKKCESLVDMSNLDIVNVRSVGSNPTNANKTSSNLFATSLVNMPSSDKGRYNSRGRANDENYLTDYKRMQELGIILAENTNTYWIASRAYTDASSYFSFNVRYAKGSSNVPSSIILLCIYTDKAEGRSSSQGVRPVISLKSDALNKYLD